ncbi:MULTISPECIES: tyrosine-protein phosphatase [unclassified Actinopolyspora]|uniref:tyrosine-protein phosphatase n=1 Tax=Actinopolyspora TaxID=1849 RepID=UPI001A99531E|nr:MULTISPECIES: tyrosine-protein phosphatase [unclassified Actinopolyspora]
MNTDSRAVAWEGFFNTRDLGGLPTRSGSTTRHGVFFRAADLRFVTDAGWSQAWKSGVRTIVDLRNTDEIRTTAESPTAQPGSAQFTATGTVTATPSGIDRIEVPLDDIDDVEFWQHVNQEQLNGSPLYYPVFLEQNADRCAAVIKAMARSNPGGVLFHCGAGRDRTGLIALLLLALADVDPEAIAADYTMSTEALTALFAALGVEDQGPIIEAVLAERGITTGEAVLATLDGFDVERYLLDAGVRSDELVRIRSRLLGSHLN